MVIAEPDIQEKKLTGEEEFILMGCDGIWETKSLEEMCEFIMKGK